MPADPNTTTSRPKYYAVITYVPEEFIWCDWLHRQLDGVRVPPELAEQRTRHGFTRPPVINVFPDPRNPAHVARHATAPPPSRHLVVICSPDSVKSPSLEEQIRAFKRTEGEDRIVVLVTDGDPSHDDEPAGPDDAAWLPAWLRWRLDKKGNFRRAEASEPLIIDARANKLDPPEARAHLLAALLDVPREKLRAYGDLLTEAASDTLTPAGAEAVETPAAAAAPARSGGGGWMILLALILAAAGGAWWWSRQQAAAPVAPSPSSESTPAPVAQAPASPTPRVAAMPPATPAATPPAAPAPSPAMAAKATPPGTVRPVAAAPAPRATPPAPTVTPSTAASTPAGPVAVAKMATPKKSSASPRPAPPAARASTPKVVAAFAPSEGPLTSMSMTPAQPPEKVEPGSSWQRMRDLGDTLIARDNRDTGLIALTQAVEVGLRTANARNTPVDERLEIARLCFRVGALQKQFMSAAEARRTLTGARTLLVGMGITDDDRRAERDSLVADIDQLLGSIP